MITANDRCTLHIVRQMADSQEKRFSPTFLQRGFLMAKTHTVRSKVYTQKSIKGLSIPDGFTTVIVRHPSITGLFAKIGKQSRTHFFQMRVRGTNQRPTIRIGDVDRINIEAVKSKALELASLCDQGINPNQGMSAAPTVTLLDGFNRFLEVSDLSKSSRKNYTLYCRHWGALRDMDMNEITGDHLVQWFNLVADVVSHQTALEGLKLLGTVYKRVRPLFTHNNKRIITAYPHTEAMELIPADMRKRQAPKGDYVISIFHLGRALATLEDMLKAATRHEDKTAYAAFMICMFTGFRIRESLSLKWENVFIDEGYIVLEAEVCKNKQQHIMPMCDYLKAHFTKLQSTRTTMSKFVFPQKTDITKFVTYTDSAVKRYRGAMGIDFNTHALRRTFATVGMELCSLNEFVMARLLNHSRSGVSVTLRYNKARKFNPTGDMVHVVAIEQAILKLRDDYRAKQAPVVNIKPQEETQAA